MQATLPTKTTLAWLTLAEPLLPPPPLSHPSSPRHPRAWVFPHYLFFRSLLKKSLLVLKLDAGWSEIESINQEGKFKKKQYFGFGTAVPAEGQKQVFGLSTSLQTGLPEKTDILKPNILHIEHYHVSKRKNTKNVEAGV